MIDSWPDYDDDEKVAWEDCKCVGESEKAIKIAGVKEQPAWFPKSVVHNDSECYKAGTDGTFVLKRWFAEKEGLV